MRGKKGGLGKWLVPFPVTWSEGVNAENFLKTGANMCNLVHFHIFVGEIRIYGVQDRGVHGSGKSQWNVIPTGIPWEWE